MKGSTIKRGDRADTGDLEARPKDGVDTGGSGVPGGHGGSTGAPTGDSSSLGGGASAAHDAAIGPEQLNQAGGEGDGGIDDLTIVESPEEAGVTNTGVTPAEDWAADTGPTAGAEGEAGAVTADPTDASSTLNVDRKTDKRTAGGRRRVG